MKMTLLAILLALSSAHAQWDYEPDHDDWRYSVGGGISYSASHGSWTYRGGFPGQIMLPSGEYDPDLSPPPQILFDTDFNEDADDAYALSMLHRYQDQGRCRIVGCVTSDVSVAAFAIDAYNTYYGRGHIPIGSANLDRHSADQPEPNIFGLRHVGGYIDPLRTLPHDLQKPLGADDIYQIAADNLWPVRVCVVGYSIAIKEALEDGVPFDNVERVIMVGGHIYDQSFSENNIQWWPESATKVLRDLPVPVYILGAEKVFIPQLRTASGSYVTRVGKRHPLRLAHESWWWSRGLPWGSGNNSADPMAVYVAVTDDGIYENRRIRFSRGRTIQDSRGVIRTVIHNPNNPEALARGWEELVWR